MRSDINFYDHKLASLAITYRTCALSCLHRMTTTVERHNNFNYQTCHLLYFHFETFKDNCPFLEMILLLQTLDALLKWRWMFYWFSNDFKLREISQTSYFFFILHWFPWKMFHIGPWAWRQSSKLFIKIHQWRLCWTFCNRKKLTF